jgi:hypothetical protein
MLFLFFHLQEGYETFHPPTLGLCDHFNPLRRGLQRVVMSGNQRPLAGYLVHSWSEWYGLILSASVLSFSFFSWVLYQHFIEDEEVCETSYEGNLSILCQPFSGFD